jgi:glycosyltransferase involved in cell wall biosynthesis
MERMALAVASGLASRGHSVHVVASGWSDGEFARRLEERGLPYERIFLGKISKSLRPRAIWWTVDALRHLPGARRQLIRHLRLYKPDALVVYNRDWAVQTRKLLEGHRTIFHVHELPQLTPLMRRVYASLNSAVTSYACASQFMAAGLIRLDAAPEKVHVVYNGIDPIISQRDANQRPIPTIGIVGQIGEWKGHDDLIEAIGIAQRNGTALRTDVFGEGDESYVAALKAKASTLGVDGLIRWRGYVRDQDAIYSEIDVCVVASRLDEAFGLTAVEAGLRGIPVVATRRGALPEIVVDGETGYLVDAKSPHELAERLMALTTNASLRRVIGENARKRVLARFTSEKMIDGIEALCSSSARSVVDA